MKYAFVYLVIGVFGLCMESLVLADSTLNTITDSQIKEQSKQLQVLELALQNGGNGRTIESDSIDAYAVPFDSFWVSCGFNLDTR